MSEPRIRLVPRMERSPRQARLLRNRLRRWVSPYEGGAEPPSVAVMMTPRALAQLAEHAASDLDNEVGGVLVGKWMVESEKREEVVLVESILRARHVRQGSTFITFTQDSLVALNDELDANHPRRLMVGWYHTHPRMGVFLSGYDTWLHQHFFPESWQVALVIEPHSTTCGFFIRTADGTLDPQRYYGFREILAEGGRSKVEWRNLAPSAPAAAEDGGLSA